ncbi:unnamed protein product [Schistosoma bovis]|nr:unnamed protein product [Schistosoma bovis]
MNTLTSVGKNGIQWTTWIEVDNSDLSNDSTLPSHTYEQVQVKITIMGEAAPSVSLNTHKGKSKILKYNMENNNPITLDEEVLEEVETLTYLDSITDGQGGSDSDLKSRIGNTAVSQHQNQNLQCGHEDSSTVLG